MPRLRPAPLLGAQAKKHLFLPHGAALLGAYPCDPGAGARQRGFPMRARHGGLRPPPPPVADGSGVTTRQQEQQLLKEFGQLRRWLGLLKGDDETKDAEETKREEDGDAQRYRRPRVSPRRQARRAARAVRLSAGSIQSLPSRGSETAALSPVTARTVRAPTVTNTATSVTMMSPSALRARTRARRRARVEGDAAARATPPQSPRLSCASGAELSDSHAPVASREGNLLHPTVGEAHRGHPPVSPSGCSCSSRSGMLSLQSALPVPRHARERATAAKTITSTLVIRQEDCLRQSGLSRIHHLTCDSASSHCMSCHSMSGSGEQEVWAPSDSDSSTSTTSGCDSDSSSCYDSCGGLLAERPRQAGSADGMFGLGQLLAQSEVGGSADGPGPPGGDSEGEDDWKRLVAEATAGLVGSNPTEPSWQ